VSDPFAFAPAYGFSNRIFAHARDGGGKWSRARMRLHFRSLTGMRSRRRSGSGDPTSEVRSRGISGEQSQVDQRASLRPVCIRFWAFVSALERNT
jgi:hypothetical protein